MREIIDLIEAKADPAMEEALWWVERWVSGSETDPDWDDSWTTMGMDEAFLLLGERMQSKIKGPLYRTLTLPRRAAVKIEKTRVLPSNHRSFQSFTTSPENAIEISYEVYPTIMPGYVRLVVEVANPPILFALSDLRQTGEWLRLGDWHHQNEVFVDGRAPLPIFMSKIIPSHRSQCERTIYKRSHRTEADQNSRRQPPQG